MYVHVHAVRISVFNAKQLPRKTDNTLKYQSKLAELVQVSLFI